MIPVDLGQLAAESESFPWTYLLVNIELPENLRGVEQMLVLYNPVSRVSVLSYPPVPSWWDSLLRIEGQQRQVQHKCQPVAIDEEEERQESVNSGFGNDVGVKTIAKVDGIDIVATSY